MFQGCCFFLCFFSECVMKLKEKEFSNSSFPVELGFGLRAAQLPQLTSHWLLAAASPAHSPPAVGPLLSVFINSSPSQNSGQGHCVWQPLADPATLLPGG